MPSGCRGRPAASPFSRSDRRRVRPYPGASRPDAERLRAGGLLAPLVGALRLQALRAASAPAAVERRARASGAGRERRRDRPRRRHCGRVQGRVAQSSVGRRALPGRRDRCRRDPARHRRDGRPADRAPRQPALRQARLALQARGRGDRPLRQLRRRPERRRRVRVRRGLCAQPARERDVRRDPADRARPLGEGAGRRQRARPLRRPHRPRRHRRRVRARLAGSRGLRREAALRSDRRPVPRQGADRGLARPRRAGTRRLAAGLRRRRARLVALRDGARRHGRRRAPRPRAAARGRHGAVGDHDLRVAGADGRGRRARAASTTCALSASAGSCRAR